MNGLQRWVHSLLSYFYYLLAVSHRHFGNQYSLTQEHESAVDGFTKAIAYNSAFARAYLERGILYWRELDHPYWQEYAEIMIRELVEWIPGSEDGTQQP